MGFLVYPKVLIIFSFISDGDEINGGNKCLL